MVKRPMRRRRNPFARELWRLGQKVKPGRRLYRRKGRHAARPGGDADLRD